MDRKFAIIFSIFFMCISCSLGFAEQDKRIIYETAEGMSVIIPSGEIPIEEVALKDVPPGVAYKIVDKSEVPSDREFRNAWKIKDEKVEIDLEKAKIIKKQKIASEAKVLIEELNLKIIDAKADGKNSKDLSGEKASIVSAEICVDNISTLQDLKNFSIKKHLEDLKPK